MGGKPVGKGGKYGGGRGAVGRGSPGKGKGKPSFRQQEGKPDGTAKTESLKAQYLHKQRGEDPAQDSQAREQEPEDKAAVLRDRLLRKKQEQQKNQVRAAHDPATRHGATAVTVDLSSGEPRAGAQAEKARFASAGAGARGAAALGTASDAKTRVVEVEAASSSADAALNEEERKKQLRGQRFAQTTGAAPGAPAPGPKPAGAPPGVVSSPEPISPTGAEMPATNLPATPRTEKKDPSPVAQAAGAGPAKALAQAATAAAAAAVPAVPVTVPPKRKAVPAPPATPAPPPTSKPAQSRPVVKPPSTPAATSTPSAPAAKSTAQPTQPGPQPPPEEKRRRLLANALQRQARTSAPRKRPPSLLTGGAQATKEVDAELAFQQKWFNTNRQKWLRLLPPEESKAHRPVQPYSAETAQKLEAFLKSLGMLES
ncbi:unnamed protein product [Symbiodinium sp. CCMP2456]|nr:unnamed protein product [Symbiodinium sp. CCMP2456]